MYKFTHLIAEAKSKFSTNLKPYAYTHDVIDTIESFHQISFNYLTLPPVKIKTRPVLFILRRRENYKEFMNMGAYGNGGFEEDISEISNENSEEKLKIEDDYTKEEQTLKVGNESDEQNDFLEVEYRSRENVPSKEERPKVEEVKEEFVKEVKKKRQSEELTEKPAKLSVEEKKVIKRKISEEKVQLESLPIRKVSKKIDKEMITDNKTKQVKPEYEIRNKDIVEKKSKNNMEDEKQNVKRNIKKLIQKYKRKNINEEVNSEVDKSNMRNPHTKDTIKKIIKEEKSKQAEEELYKIEEQIFEIIETNPNIINKNIIKEKIHNTISKELIPVFKSKQLIIAYEKEKTQPNKQEQLIKKKKSIEIPEIVQLKKDEQKINKKPEEKPTKKSKEIDSEIFEDPNAIDLYEPPDFDDSIETNPPDVVQEEDEEEENEEFVLTHIQSEQDVDGEDFNKEKIAQMSEKFMEASQKIADIMTIIDEIVDTIEITEDSDESS